MNINAVLVDDEPKALAILRNKIERFCPRINIVGQTQHPEEAIAIINKEKPQLVFLDIAMPQISGFDLLKEIDNLNFEIIFVTAFDQYAIDAINHCAIGYLLKPVDNQSLIETVNKAITNIEEKTALKKNRLLIDNLGITTFLKKKIVIPSQEGLEFVKIEDVIHLEGNQGYTSIHLVDRKPILSSYSIGHFHKILDNQIFYLVHKSHLINTNHIERYLNEGYLLLSNHQNVPVSRNRRQDFLDRLKGS